MKVSILAALRYKMLPFSASHDAPLSSCKSNYSSISHPPPLNLNGSSIYPTTETSKKGTIHLEEKKYIKKLKNSFVNRESLNLSVLERGSTV